MKIIVKRVNQPPEMVEVEDKLETYQKIVGGYIETVPLPLAPQILMVVNEEGLIIDLPINFMMGKTPICGDAFFCGVDGENFADCPLMEAQVRALLKIWGNK